MSKEFDTLPIARPATLHWAEAAQFFEQAVRAGCRDAQVHYLLAMCYKRLGKPAEARDALRRISNPDANVHLQLGLLAFRERDFAAAEQSFKQSWQLDPTSYAAAYNLLLAQLSLGNMDGCLELAPQLAGLAPSVEEKRFLAALSALLHAQTPAVSGNGADYALADMTAADERRIVDVLGSLGQFHIAYPLLSRLAEVRPHSLAAQDAYLEVLLVQAHNLMDRSQWEEARDLLAPMGRQFAVKTPLLSTGGRGERGEGPVRPTHVALLNMLGCASCLVQDFEQGIWYFTWALAKAGDDAWLHQNLALAYEWQGRSDHAEKHWNAYLDMMNKNVPAPALANYHQNVAFEALIRLADIASKRERWSYVLSCLQRAVRLRPQDSDTLERIFHLCSQLKKPEEARRTLKRLRELRPNDPQFDLLELDLREVRTVDDVDNLIADVRRVLNKHANDMRIGERATVIVNNLLPLLRRVCDQLTEQLNKVADQLRRLPNYQINWRAVRDVMHELQEEYQKVRRLLGKCSQAVASEETRRQLKDLMQLIDRKIEMCQSMRG